MWCKLCINHQNLTARSFRLIKLGSPESKRDPVQLAVAHTSDTMCRRHTYSEWDTVHSNSTHVHKILLLNSAPQKAFSTGFVQKYVGLMDFSPNKTPIKTCFWTNPVWNALWLLQTWTTVHSICTLHMQCTCSIGTWKDHDVYQQFTTSLLHKTINRLSIIFYNVII